MPQMMPLYWTLMLMFLITLMIFFSSFIYFYTPYFMLNYPTIPVKTPPLFKFFWWNWKW